MSGVEAAADRRRLHAQLTRDAPLESVRSHDLNVGKAHELAKLGRGHFEAQRPSQFAALTSGATPARVTADDRAAHLRAMAVRTLHVLASLAGPALRIELHKLGDLPELVLGV